MTESPRDQRRARSSSRAKIAANRTNAQRSTGPKSAVGKQRSARNALSHGLSVSLSTDAHHSEQADRFARLIAGLGASDLILGLARVIAEAQIDLNRVREARSRILKRRIDDPNDGVDNKQQRPGALAAKRLCQDAQDRIGQYDPALPSRFAPLKLAAAMNNVAAQLVRLDRYETRARSRRKTAIRAFDASRADNPRSGDLDAI